MGDKVLIRLLHPTNFSQKKQRLKSIAFKNSSTGGVSVIDSLCAKKRNGTECQHIRRFYSKISGDPVVFWRLQTSELPEKTSLESKPSSTGDDCHMNVKNMSDKEC